MKPEQILPIIMILLSLGSSAGYAVCGDWRRMLYWAFAAGITTTVTF